MALAISLLVADPDTSNVANFVTPSVTPAGAAGIVVCVCNSKSAAPDLPSLDLPTWLSGSWTQEATLVNGPDNSRMTLFSGRSIASPGADTLAADFAAANQTSCTIIIVQATGEDATDFVLQPAIADFATATSGSKTLAGPLAAASSACLAFFYEHQNTAPAHTPTGGETEIADVGHATPIRCLSCQYEINDTTSSASWATSSVHLIGIMEIKAASAGLSAAIGQAAETNVAQPVAWAPKHRLLARVLESDAAQAIPARKAKALGFATEADAALAISARKSRALGQITETDLAQGLGRLKARTLGLVSESDLAQAFGRLKARALGQASELDEARAISPAAPANVLGQAGETDTASALGRLKARTLGLASESDLAQTVAVRKIRVLGPALEADLSQALARAKSRALGQTSELDIARPFVIVKILGRASEVDVARAIALIGGAAITGRVTLGRVRLVIVTAGGRRVRARADTRLVVTGTRAKRL